MGKLKCWKKDVNLDWAKVFLQKKKDGDVVTVTRYNDGWHSAIFPNKGGMIKKEKLTESQALKFANKYMKEHDKC